MGHFHCLPAKVSSISNTNENKGVSISKSHKVPGKSSTDGTSSVARKSGSLSLDALARAKKALLMQKETNAKGTGREVEKDSTTGTKSSALAAGNPPASGMEGLTGLATTPNIEAVKCAQELAVKMGFWQDLEFALLINLFPGQMPPEVNINKQKKDAFQILKPKLEVDLESNPHFDQRMGINKNKLLTPKWMSFQFVKEGKWSKEAKMIKLKCQFGEERAKDLKARQALHAKAKTAPDINPNLKKVSERVIIKEKTKEPIPEIEGWDVPLLSSGTYSEIDDGIISDKLKMEKITIYVEHPRPIKPPTE